MQWQYSVIGYFVLILIPNEGLRIGDGDNDINVPPPPPAVVDTLIDPLCRIVRNARNMLLQKKLEPDSTFLNSCEISDSCTSLLCSINTTEKNDRFGWTLGLCDAKTPTINFLLNSASVNNSNWSYLASPLAIPQRIKVPLQMQHSKNGAEYYLNVTFLRQFSQIHGSDEKWSTLSLDVSIEVCNRTCGSTEIFRDIRFPLRQLCEFPLESAPGSLIKTLPEEVQIPASVTSHIGMPCSLENPFTCGINSVCRRREGGKEDEGTCDCCDHCELFSNGSCSSRTTTSTSTELPSHEGDKSMVVTGVGSFVAILSLFFLGGAIFYSVKYNVVTMVRNHLRVYWTSWCGRRVVEVDQGSMSNPLYDDDEPALL